jgi:hypothetical protein
VSGADLRGAISAANAWVNESGCDCVACIVRAAFQYCAPALRWRREPPDAPGWYWYCDLQRYGRRVRIEHWDERKIKELGRMGLGPHPHRPRWAGPLPYPEKEA